MAYYEIEEDTANLLIMFIDLIEGDDSLSKEQCLVAVKKYISSFVKQSEEVGV